MLVVPGEVKRQLLFECGKTIRDNAQTSSAFVFDSSNPTLNHRQTPVFPQSTESMANPLLAAPSSEPSRSELNALVGDENVRDFSRTSKGSFEEAPYRGRRGQSTINSESRDPAREVIDNHREPPAERPNLGQREGKPGHPEAQGSGHGRQIDVPELVWLFRAHDIETQLAILREVSATAYPIASGEWSSAPGGGPHGPGSGQFSPSLGSDKSRETGCGFLTGT